MADTYTTNLGLTKSGYDSPVDVGVLNANLDKIDNAVANAGKVKSVNGKTGDVSLSASDVGALPSDGTAANATQLNGKGASEYALEDTLALIHDRIYPGVDLTVKFADEIANYSDEWAWITARIKAGNFSGIHVSDYIPVTTGRTDGFTFKAQIAGIDTYYQYGDSAVGHHIDFISKELWPDLMVMNQVNYNNGTANTPYPWLASHCYALLMWITRRAASCITCRTSSRTRSFRSARCLVSAIRRVRC